MLAKRKRSTFSGLSSNGPLHWASILIARDHRREDNDGWQCQCIDCDRVKAELYRTGTFAEVRRLMNGGAK